MTLKEFQACVEFNIEHGIKHSILGLGAPGVGKSQVIRQIGKKYGYKVIDIRLAQMSEVEIGGLIYPNEDRTKTKWLSPEILPDEERDGKNTILLLDEITSCPKRVQVAAYQLILDRRVGQYTLPEGTVVVALGNREDDDGVYIRLAGPLADRFEIHYIDVDFNSWKYDFAIPYGVHNYIVDYLTFKPSALHNQSESMDDMVFATPRSWERVSDILKIDDNLNNPVVCHKIIGNVGETEGNQFIRYIKNHSGLISVDEFLQGKDADEKPELMATLINALMDKVYFIKNVQSFEELDESQKQMLFTVIKSLFRFRTAEFTVMGIKQLLELNRGAVKTAFAQCDDVRIDKFLDRHARALGL
ncbi:MAG: AAA family ATPase [Butyrivibrio sp.]|uniref:AAA family ATPase n=1 Tax=Butyrivibrio sp. TaxID=28121 RepID=UPI0025C2BDA4|nr:MoxR family ATPase [Butyrivibrio sp.]MBQ6588123.1 AAA family ATPase [Butyrivibrio sp.]